MFIIFEHEKPFELRLGYLNDLEISIVETYIVQLRTIIPAFEFNTGWVNLLVSQRKERKIMNTF